MADPMSAVDVDDYLARIHARRPDALDVEALTSLQLAHLRSVPFENLDVFDRRPVTVDENAIVAKIAGGRGGWCFEANGGFAWLLEQLGFEVRRLGAAVLIDGPNTLIDHLAIEVQIDRPYLVDVGFGDSFTRPLDLTRSGPQAGGKAEFEFMPSPQGTTLAEYPGPAESPGGAPMARYRFKRVTHTLDQFAEASQRLYDDADAHWQRWPFATRLLRPDEAGGADDGDGAETGNEADRVTLLADRLKIRRGGETIETPVAEADWDDVLAEWFGMRRGPRS